MANRWLPIEERLFGRIVVTDSGCHEWTGPVNSGGYGRINFNGRMTLTHRIAWELVNGPIPDGVDVLHHCDNPPCCNADKCLFLGTDADNAADAASKGRHHCQKRIHCPQGHPYDEENTIVNRRGWRECRTCRKEAKERKI